MQGLAIFAKVLCASHEFAQMLEDLRRSSADLSPRPAQSVDWRSPKGRDDGCKRRVVVESATFLGSSVSITRFLIYIYIYI